MVFLGIYLGTVFGSFIITILKELMFFKDLADLGYKINIKKLTAIEQELNIALIENSMIFVLLPIINILHTFLNVSDYNCIRQDIIDILDSKKALENMSASQIDEYQKNPTALNALFINTKEIVQKELPNNKKIDTNNYHSIEFVTSEGKNEIFYTWDELSDSINIVNVTGPISKLNNEEQKEIIIEIWYNALQLGIEKYNSIDNFENAFNGNCSINLDNKNMLSEENCSTKKEILEQFKNDLLDRKDVQETSIEDRPKLTNNKNIKRR